MRSDIIESLIQTSIQSEEVKTSASIRPTLLDDYFGQSEIKENLKVYIEATKKRHEALDHVLLYGCAGLGKTTLAQIIANELGKNIKITSAPAIEKAGELVSVLCSLSDGDVLFIDEIHRLSKAIEEVLYSAMEDFVVDVTIGKDGQSKTIRIDLPRFTLIGATTRAGMLSAPLRDRFGIVLRMQFYNQDELSQIISRSAGLLGYAIDEKGAYYIADCSRGTPRIANNLLKRCIDFATVEQSDIVTEDITCKCLRSLGLENHGLNEIDRSFLNILAESKTPVGLSTLACKLGEDEGTIENVIEPYLIYRGYILKTPKGRILGNVA